MVTSSKGLYKRGHSGMNNYIQHTFYITTHQNKKKEELPPSNFRSEAFWSLGLSDTHLEWNPHKVYA